MFEHAAWTKGQYFSGPLLSNRNSAGHIAYFGTKSTQCDSIHSETWDSSERDIDLDCLEKLQPFPRSHTFD